MARIDWVKDRLENWARWAVQRQAGALGYPRQSVFARLAGKGTRAEAVIPIDDVDAALTDDAVNALRWDKPHLYLTLQCIYVQGREIAETAQRLGRAPSTIKAHLEQADQLLAVWFRERAERAARDRAALRGSFST